jgi:hypothetical protein
MDLKIFNSIIFGEMQPFSGENRNEAYFSEKLNPKFTLPDNLEQFEDQLRLALKDHPYLYEQNEFLINLNPEKEIIEIKLFKEDIFEPLIDIDTPPPFNSTTEFYFYLIKNEATRVTSKIITEIKLVNCQDDAVFIIKKVITQIEYLLSNLGKEIKALDSDRIFYYENTDYEFEQDRIRNNTHYIYNFLLLTLVRLYFELENLFSITYDIKFRSREQLLIDVVGKPLYKGKLPELSKGIAINYAKKLINNHDFDANRAYVNWRELNEYFKNDKSNQKLEQAIAAIENKLFLHSKFIESNNYPFADLHSYNLFDDILSQTKDRCRRAIEQKDYGFERLEIVDGFIDAISKQFKGHNFENVLIDNSVPRNLFKWLGIQAKLYSSELSKSFTQPVVIHQGKEVQQDRKTESLFTPLKHDIRDIAKGVLSFSTMIKNPERFAAFEEKLYDNKYIDVNYKFQDQHGMRNELAMIYYFLISKNYFHSRYFPGNKIISDLHIRKFLDHRYTTSIDKQFRSFKNKPDKIATFVENNSWLGRIPSC